MSQPIMTIRYPMPTEKTALRAMRGHTMGAIEDGWLLYYEDNKTPPQPDINGRLCICKLRDGRILTRKVWRAWVPDRWDLETVSGEQSLNQDLEWAERVTLIMPYDLSDEEKLKIAEADEI